MKDTALVFKRARDLGAHLDSVRARRPAPRVVLASGCFDPLHVGHVRYLVAAKAAGDYLVVAVNDDASTRRLKGPDRPILRAAARAMLVASLKPVDVVLVRGGRRLLRWLDVVRPDVLAVAAGGLDDAADAARRGAKVVEIGDARPGASDAIVERVRAGGEA